MSNQVCTNYASAFFSLIDLKKAKEYKIALKEIDSLLRSNVDISKFLCAYGMDKNNVEKVIKSISDSVKLDYLENFLLLIHKKHRMNQFSQIQDEFSHLVNDYLGIKEGYAYSSIKLEKEEMDNIEKALSKKLNCEVELHNVIDSSLLGGVKVSIDGKVYDNTLKTSLENLTKSLLGGNSL